MEETQTTAPPVQPEPASSPPAPSDPFSLDENSLVSLLPEQRAALDPIITSWKQRAVDEIKKRESTASERLKPFEEKASALDKLIQYQPFVKWWNEQNQPQTNSSPGAAQPADIATQQEWQDAIYEASIGNGVKLQTLQQKMMATWAAPVVQQLSEKQKNLETRMELQDLFESHPDAKELDSVGLDPTTKEGTSLLEMCLDWAERNRKSLEDGYKMARRWSDSMKVGAQREAMGLVDGKKDSVVAAPSTTSSSRNVVEVESIDELMKKSMDSQLSGQKDVRFVLKGKS